MTNILFTCAGRRTYLLQYFKEQLGSDGLIVGADMQTTAPALTAADVKVTVPSVYSSNYVDSLLEICKTYEIKAVFSLNDLELPILAENKIRFNSIGTIPVVSDSAVIETCFDKYKTYEFIKSIGLDSPVTFVRLEDAQVALENGDLNFPVVVKPRWGSGSIGIEIVHNESELKDTYEVIKKKLGDTILATASIGDETVLIQEYIEGTEYGMDVMNDFDGNNLGIAVKKKLAMRAGETDKAVTVNNMLISGMGAKISNALRHIGNLDCDVLEKDGRYCILELNPRFGGGFPFTYLAGVNYPKVLIDLINGNTPDYRMLQLDYGRTFAKCDYLVEV